MKDEVSKYMLLILIIVRFVLLFVSITCSDYCEYNVTELLLVFLTLFSYYICSLQ